MCPGQGATRYPTEVWCSTAGNEINSEASLAIYPGRR